MNEQTLRTFLDANRQTLLSVAVTAVLIGSLVAVATPSGAVETTLTGPEEVDRNERITTTATVDLKDGERIPIDAFVLTIRPAGADEGESLAVTFAPNGTVLDVTPERGTINDGDIRIQQFVQKLTITPNSLDAPYGYGYRTGYDERDGDSREFGYGYGYGYGDGELAEFEYTISFPATAFDRGSYVGQLSVDTGDEIAFSSDEFQFEVTRPNADKGGPPDDAKLDDAPGRFDSQRGPQVERFGGYWDQTVASQSAGVWSGDVPGQSFASVGVAAGN